MSVINSDDRISDVELTKDASSLSLPQDNQKPLTRFQRITDFLKRYGIETNG